MEQIEKIILEALFKSTKVMDKSLHSEHINLYYTKLSEILAESNITMEEAIFVIKDNPYMEWDNFDSIKITPLGYEYCQTQLNKKGMGFINL